MLMGKINHANQYIGNWLGGEVVSNEVGQPGFDCSGYTNISTSDGTVHGQVKQSGAFSFVRIYESGHVSVVEAFVPEFESVYTIVGSEFRLDQAMLIPRYLSGGTILSARDSISYL